MNKPTGMSTGTAFHYYNVNNQLREAANPNNRPRLNPAFGQFHQFRPMQGLAFGSNVSHNAVHRLGVPPMANHRRRSFN